MSYFVVVCGDIADLNSGLGKFTALADAQPYVAIAVKKFADQERGPFYLWDDRESGTSSGLMFEAEEHLPERRSIVDTSLFLLLSSAETCRCSVYIWWADGKEDLRELPCVSTVNEAVALMDRLVRTQSTTKIDIKLAFRPAAR
jgi:hypothetical protein